MATLALGLVVIFAVATALFFIAGDLYGHGSAFARDVCSLSRTLCDHPAWGLAATGIMGAVHLLLRAFRL
jgi:hypothetical protein